MNVLVAMETLFPWQQEYCSCCYGNLISMATRILMNNFIFFSQVKFIFGNFCNSMIAKQSIIQRYFYVGLFTDFTLGVFVLVNTVFENYRQ